MPAQTTFTWQMTGKLVWTTALTVTLSATTICAFLACGVVMEMMTVEMGLMSHPPAHQDTAHQVTPHQEMISAETDFPHMPFYSLNDFNCLN